MAGWIASGGRRRSPARCEQLQPDRPERRLLELLVEHLEQEAGALLLAGAGEGARHADEVVEVAGLLAQARQPFALDGVEIALGEVGLGRAGDRHGAGEDSRSPVSRKRRARLARLFR